MAGAPCDEAGTSKRENVLNLRIMNGILIVYKWLIKNKPGVRNTLVTFLMMLLRTVIRAVVVTE